MKRWAMRNSISKHLFSGSCLPWCSWRNTTLSAVGESLLRALRVWVAHSLPSLSSATMISSTEACQAASVSMCDVDQ